MALKGFPLKPIPPIAPLKPIPPIAPSTFMKQPPQPPDYSPHLQAQPVVSMTTVEKSIKGEPVTMGSGSETITQHPGVFTQQPGMSISIEGGRTINLGNYESAKIGVTITVPCDANSLADAYEWSTDWVSAKIEAAMKDAKGV
jgi:hypothetical protein